MWHGVTAMYERATQVIKVARSSVFRFKLNGRMRKMGLGPLSRVSLGEARKPVAGYRDMVRDLIDPIVARREQQRRQLLDISPDANVTFREATEAFIRTHEPQWRNRKHVQIRKKRASSAGGDVGY